MLVDRVHHIAGLMARGEWQAGASHKELAREWGVCENTVERYAAEASRAVLRAIDREAITGQSLAAYERILRMAFERETPYGKDAELHANPDLATAVRALDSRAKLLKLGGFAEQKSDAGAMPTTPLQRLAWVRANLPELERQAAEFARLNGGTDDGQQGIEAANALGADGKEGPREAIDGDEGLIGHRGMEEGRALRRFDPGDDEG